MQHLKEPYFVLESSMLRVLPCLLLFVVAFTGCAEPTSTAESSEAADAAASVDVSDVSDAVAGNVSKDEVSSSKWLSVPEGVSPQQARDYIMVCDMASEEDPNSMANLGFVTQKFAFALAQSGKKEDVVYPFFKQAANGFRSALEGGVDEIPTDMLSQTFYFEGVAHGHDGNVAASIAALDDAFKNGFTQLDFLMDDDALANVRASDQWASKVEMWKESVAEAFREEAKELLSGGEKFAFTMTGTSVDGEEIALEALKGKVVIVDFWGTWCPPCRAEIPAFIKLQETYGDDGFQMIGLNYERAPSDEAKAKLVTDYASENGINYPCLLGDEALQDQVPEFRGYPTTLFIDRSGSVRHMAVGQHPYEYLEAIVSELLNEQ